MLTGREHFYGEWLRLVSRVVERGPVLDLGTSEPFRKEMAPLADRSARPYLCLDVLPSPAVDVVADGAAVPLRSGSVGAVLCSHVLEHVTEPGRVVDEVRRVLRPGGRAYFTFLDTWPYHAKPGAYRDFHRFKRDAIHLLLTGWASVEVVPGGGAAQVAANFLPARLHPAAVRAANVVDRRWPTTLTPVNYVFATR